MSLPVYIINPEEFGSAVAEYLGKDITVTTGDVTIDTSQLSTLLQEIKDKMPSAIDLDLTGLITALNNLNIKITNLTSKLGFTGIQKIYGKSLDIPATIGDYIIEFDIEKQGRITGITYSQSSWQYTDNWDLSIGEIKIFSNIYTKEYGENKSFYNFYDVDTGDKVYFTYHNNSASNKILWVDLEISEGCVVDSETPVTPILTVPDAPTLVSVYSGDKQVTLNFSAPINNGGSTIIDYKIDVYNDKVLVKTVDTKSIAITAIITELTNGIIYTFDVKATNAIGDSVASNSLFVEPVEPTPTVESTTSNYLSRFTLTDITNTNYIDPSKIDLNYWNLNNESIPVSFWDGRNAILNKVQTEWINNGNIYSNSVINTITDFHKYLYLLSQDIRKNGLVLTDFEMNYDNFINLCNKGVTNGGYGIQSLTSVEKTEIYLTYVLKTITLIFPSCESLLVSQNINYFKNYLPIEKLKVLEWIDFNEINPKKTVGATTIDLGQSGDLKNFKTYMNIEPNVFDITTFNANTDPILTPYFYKEYHEGDIVDGDGIGTNTDTGEKLQIKKADSSFYLEDDYLMPIKTFCHELGHGIDYQYETLTGTRLTNLDEWRNIGGWSYGDPGAISSLNPQKYALDCIVSDTEPPVSLYGCTLTYEDFADSYSCYCINPNYLKTYYPKRYAFIEKYIKNLAIT